MKICLNLEKENIFGTKELSHCSVHLVPIISLDCTETVRLGCYGC